MNNSFSTYPKKPVFKRKWQEREDSDQEDDSLSFDAEDLDEVKDFVDLLKELLNECKKLNTVLQQRQV